MFRKAKNIDTAFRQNRWISLTSIIAALIICCFVTYKSYELSKTIQGKIYVLGNGKALEAFATDRKINLAVEAKSHISNFHYYFFTLSPDEKQIQENIRRALYLADNTAKRQYDNLKESNYYTSGLSGNISQRVSIDSVALEMDEQPFRFRCYAHQEITRPTSVVVRSLVTEGALREVERSDQNAHGFLIERWKIIDNKDISVKNR